MAGDGTALVRASLPALGLGIVGDIRERAPHAFSARVTADDADVARVLDVLGMAGSIGADTDGTVSAQADVSGSAFTLAGTAARIDVTQLSGRLLGVPMRLVDAAHVEIDATRVRTTPARLTVGGLAIGVHGETGNTPSALVATIDGPLEAAVPLLARLDPDHEWSGTGTVAARVELRGPPADAAITGTVSASAGTVLRDDVQVARELVVEGRLTGDRLEVTDVRGAVLGATVVGHGDAPAEWVTSWLPRSDRTSAPTAAAPATFSARAEVDVDGLFAGLGRLRPPTLHGQLTLALQARASEPSLDAITGELVAERGHISIVEQEELAQVRPTRLILDAGRLTVDTFDWKSAQARVTASGVVGLLEGTTTDITLTSDSTLRLADMLIPGRTTGRARTNLRVTGPAGAPQVSGDIVIEDASLLLPGARFALAGWSGTLALSDRGLDVRGLRGQFNGGDISVEGRLGTGPSASANDTIAITARGVFLDVPKGFRSEADADLTLGRKGAGTVLGGRLVLTSGQYREPVTRMLELVDTLSKAAGDDTPGTSLPAWLETIGFDVELQSTDPVLVQNSIGRIELMARMRLVGTVAAPALTGAVDVLDDGRVSIAGRSYRVRESDLRFSPDEGVIPTLRLTGETKIGDYIVQLRIEGTPDQVETTYTSDPPLGERDLRSLIITGRADTGTGSGDDQFAMTSASADVLGFAGKFVGLDSVRLGAADLELVSADVKPAQHLTVSKALNRRLEIIASQNLDENTLTWIVAWRPRSNYQIRLALRENTDYAIEFRQELDFGSGARRAPVSRSRSAHTKPGRITAVRIAGEPGFRDDEVLGVLKLSPGDAFDVQKWIEDRARLQRFYRARGYFGARIVPKRSEVTTPDGEGVSLDYAIHRGPQTILDIRGELPGRVVEQMRAAWSSAPLTDFLVEDLVGIVRGHLEDEGYLRANVTARIAEQTTEIERVAIVVDRGAKSTRRQLAFVGNEVLSSAELLQFVHERDLDVAVWQDPVAFTRAVGDLYGARGFLRAVVRLGTARYEGNLVTLPVEITEGAQAQVAAVTLSGVMAERLAGARDALGMEGGSPYRRGAEGAARQRVEQVRQGARLS